MCAKGATLSANDAIMCAKGATLSAKDATMNGKDATMCTKDATMSAKDASRAAARAEEIRNFSIQNTVTPAVVVPTAAV